PELVHAIEDELTEAEKHLKIAPPTAAARAPLQFVRAVQQDLDDFRRSTGARRVIAVNVATTEQPAAAELRDLDLDALDAALHAPGSRVPASALYAYAALDMGVPYVNFTPSVGASLPGLEELARVGGVPHAGRDGNTGETLLKSALAPMFRMRHLHVRTWVGFNVLGNADGLALSDPATAASKTESKGKVVPSILGYEPQTLVRIDYVPTLGDWKTAWDLIQFEGFLGTPMTLQFTWQGSDSALAAPLVLALIRLVHQAAPPSRHQPPPSCSPPRVRTPAGWRSTTPVTRRSMPVSGLNARSLPGGSRVPAPSPSPASSSRSASAWPRPPVSARSSWPSGWSSPSWSTTPSPNEQPWAPPLWRPVGH